MEAAAADRNIAARIERLPLSSWHIWIGVVICTGFFFDAFDIMTLSYAMPVLVGEWHLAPAAIGGAISIGFVGQIFGALLFGWTAERWGRVPSIMATILLFSLMSFACAFAGSLKAMMALRFIQGFGLGGAIPVLATYINEFAQSRRRGRFVLSYQCAFAIGLPVTAWIGTWVVPHFGWQWMFVHRRRARAFGAAARPASAGKPALACQSRPHRGSRPRIDAGRALHLAWRRAAAAADRGRPAARAAQRHARRRSLPRHLSEAHAHRLDDLVLHLRHHLWLPHLAADGVAHGLSHAGRRGARISRRSSRSCSCRASSSPSA